MNTTTLPKRKPYCLHLLNAIRTQPILIGAAYRFMKGTARISIKNVSNLSKDHTDTDLHD